jgi:hypothetical protein
VSASPLPSGDDARRLELSHLYLTAPVRLNAGRRGAPGLPALHAAIGGVSIDLKGWLFAWMAYVETAADVPGLSVWPAAGRGVPFDPVLPADAEVEVLARVDTPERAVGRLARHLQDVAMLRIEPDIDYLRRAVAAFRAERRRERDRAAEA